MWGGRIYYNTLNFNRDFIQKILIIYFNMVGKKVKKLHFLIFIFFWKFQSKFYITEKQLQAHERVNN